MKIIIPYVGSIHGAGNSRQWLRKDYFIKTIESLAKYHDSIDVAVITDEDNELAKSLNLNVIKFDCEPLYVGLKAIEYEKEQEFDVILFTEADHVFLPFEVSDFDFSKGYYVPKRLEETYQGRGRENRIVEVMNGIEYAYYDIPYSGAYISTKEQFNSIDTSNVSKLDGVPHYILEDAGGFFMERTGFPCLKKEGFTIIHLSGYEHNFYG